MKYLIETDLINYLYKVKCHFNISKILITLHYYKNMYV